MDYKTLLLEKNVRATTARVLILKALANISKPETISSIYQKLKSNCDQATVYRSVKLLVKKKLVKRVNFREGKYRYELEGDHHHHLVCKNCNTVKPIYGNCLRLTDAAIAKKYNFKVTEHHLEFFGLCQKCS